MTIKYKTGTTTLSGVEKKYPQLVQGETITGDQFQEKVAQRAARGLADATAIFVAAGQVLREELRDEQSVQIPGVGWFTLSLKGNLDEGERLVTESARLKVNFRAERDLAQDVNADLRFEYVGD